MIIESLRTQFKAKSVSFSQQDNLVIIAVNNRFADATITTHGACVLSFIPKWQKDILWVSPATSYDGKSPVRGGIPICWPWFGKHPLDSALPAHGFVRNRVWVLDQVLELDSGETELVFNLDSTDETLAMWPYQFHLQLKVNVGRELVVSLTTVNLNHSPVEITEAFHSYFKVADARDLLIGGLENTLHLDKLTDVEDEQQAESIILNPPMDSVYLNHIADVKIKDEGNQRTLVVKKTQAKSCVIWNPGVEIVKGFEDIPNNSWPKFVCVEAGNVLDNRVTIASGEKHIMTMVLSSETRA